MVPVWRDVNFTVSPGSRLLIDGPSGSGKSLLLRAVAGLDPSDGECRLHGKTPTEWGVPQFRSRVMYVPQRPSFAPGTVADAMAQPFGFGVHQHRAWDEGRAAELLEALGRDAALLRQDVDTLSGGQQQRTAIARALSKGPTILLCDEPTGALDYTTAKDVLRMIQKINKEYKSTIIIATHNTAIASMSHEVLSLHDGTIMEHRINDSIVDASELVW